MDLKQVLNNSVREYGNRVAFFQYAGNKSVQPISYAQFGSEVNALGTALLDVGLGGKRIAIMGENSYEWGLSYLAVMNGVGIVVALDKELTTKELFDSIERASIDAIIYSKEVEKKIHTIQTKAKVGMYISMSKHGKDVYIHDLVTRGNKLIVSGDRLYIDAHINADSMAALLFTSGTTSKSKIVMLSHRNIVSDMLHSVKPFRLTPHDKFLSILPMHHMFECNAGFLVPIYSGCSIYFSQGIRHIAQEFKEQRPSVVICVPRIIDALSLNIWKSIRQQNKENVVQKLIKLSDFVDKTGMNSKKRIFAKVHNELGGNIRFFLSGAASLNHVNAKNMTNLGFTIFQGYGLTECSPAVSLTHYDMNDMDSVGVPISNTDVKVYRPDANGIGEIIVKGPQVMLGYYENPIETKNVMRRGYFHTGDLGIIKPNGCIKIVSRTKNIIVLSGGKKIYPEEIESLLLECEHIKDVVVYGKEHKRGIVVTAEIVLADSDSEAHKKRFEASARKHVKQVNAGLSSYEQIHAVKVRDIDFERTSTLKIKRYVL